MAADISSHLHCRLRCSPLNAFAIPKQRPSIFTDMLIGLKKDKWCSQTGKKNVVLNCFLDKLSTAQEHGLTCQKELTHQWPRVLLKENASLSLKVLLCC